MKSFKYNRLIMALIVLLLAALAGCDQTETYTSPDWFTERGNLGHTASTNSSITLPLSERWRVDLGDGVRSSVIGSFGNLYVGADDNIMYALSPQDGSVKWTFQAEGKISSTATAVGENKGESKYLWFVAEDGNLYALDANNGDLLWTIPGGVGTFNSSTNYASGVVYYTFMSTGVSSKTRAVDGATGNIIWESSFGFNITTAAPMHGAGTLFQGLTQGGTVFRAFDPMNGDVDWEIIDTSLVLPASYTSGVIDTDVGVGNFIRIFVSVRDRSIRAIKSTDGSMTWETELTGIGEVSGLALTQNRDSNVLVVSQNSDLYALEPSTGNIIWHIQHSGNYRDPTTRNTPKPAIYGEYVFQVEDGINLVARRLSDGIEEWRVELDAMSVSSPTVGGDTVYIATTSGAVYAFSPGTQSVDDELETIPCVPFREYFVGHNFGNPWEHTATEFTFTSISQMIIGGYNNINGLAIEDAGLRVELPGVTENVTIQAMAMGTAPLTIDALDGSKNYVDQVIVPADGNLQIVHLTATEISTVTFTDGSNEALLIEICIGDFYR